jgi:tetratricopeptide (TPR) repeat protein
MLFAGFMAYHWLTPPAAMTSPAPRPSGASNGVAAAAAAKPGAEQALGALLVQRTEELGIVPKTLTTPSDLALEAALAVKSGNFAKAEQIAADVLADSRRESWRFYPFNEFLGSFARGDDPALLQQLNTWLSQQPKSAFAHLYRAAYYDEIAWAARGGEVVSMVPPRLLSQFSDDLGRARADLESAIDLRPDIPISYYEWLAVVSGDGDSADVEKVFLAAIARFPNYYPLYKTRLHSLSPKWGGSIGAMNAFVARYADAAPADSPLKLLNLDLYAQVLESAADDCRGVGDGARQQCVKAFLWLRGTHDLDDRLATALNLYRVSDPVQFSTAVWPLLETISCNRCIGAPDVSGRVLQLAASIMGSDNRMTDESAHNSYVLDDITARVWAQMGNPANADKKFREALRDVEKTSFPHAADKARSLATILDHMAAVADDNSQFIDIIVYRDAANAVDGINHTPTPWRKCYAYYRMKYFAAAVEECTRLIESNGNYLQTHYWRAKAYEGLGQWDASIADFTPVADSADNWFRVGAALDMSYDFGQKGDFAGQLASMNQYPYLFDANIQPPHDLAVAYNNRCFAYMKLGRLKEALDDCTTSLKYDRIPDAFQKQQELFKLLGVKAI